jgi:DNA-directed RNA polymerase specialized sigma24 family protein
LLFHMQLVLLRYGADRLSHEEVAARLNITSKRVREMLRRASRAIPLVADATPLEVVGSCTS